MKKIDYKKVAKINVSNKLLSNSKYQVSLFVDVNLENNNVFFILASKKGCSLFYSLESAVEKYNDIINTVESDEWTCPKIVNEFSFKTAIFDHELNNI